MRKCIAVVLLSLSALPAMAKDHAAEYQIGIFSSTEVVSDGNVALCNRVGCRSSNTGHNVHYVTTDAGVYAIEAPVSVGASILLGVATDGLSSNVHKQWFMDQLNDGDKVIFAVRCNKHNNCDFWLPNPDKIGKEFVTVGSFRPYRAKTNTTSLCGKGKLPPDVEEKVCGTGQAPAPVVKGYAQQSFATPAPAISAPAGSAQRSVTTPATPMPASLVSVQEAPAQASFRAQPSTTPLQEIDAKIQPLEIENQSLNSASDSLKTYCPDLMNDRTCLESDRKIILARQKVDESLVSLLDKKISILIEMNTDAVQSEKNNTIEALGELHAELATFHESLEKIDQILAEDQHAKSRQ